MTTAILSIKKSVFSFIKDLFAAPKSQASEEVTSFAITPISAVLDVANTSKLVYEFDHQDFYQGFVVKKHLPMDFALSFISSGVMTSLGNNYNEGEPSSYEQDTALQNLSYMAGLAPISGIYSAMLAEQKAMNVARGSVEETNEQDTALQNLSYMAGLAPISGIYSAMLAEQKGMNVARESVEETNEQDTALQNLSYMAGLAPISGIYSAMLAEQKGMNVARESVEDTNEQDTALQNLSYMAGLAPISGIYSAMLAEQKGINVARESAEETNEQDTALQNLSYMAGLAPISGIYSAMLAQSDKIQLQTQVIDNTAPETEMALPTEQASAHESIMALRNLSYMGGLAPISGIYTSMLAEINNKAQENKSAQAYEPSELEIAKHNANKALRSLAMSAALTPISTVYSSLIAQQATAAQEALALVNKLEPEQNQQVKAEQNSVLSNFLMRMFTYLGSVELAGSINSDILAHEIRAKRDAVVAKQAKHEHGSTLMRLVTYMGALSPISGINAQVLAEQIRAARDEQVLKSENKHFAVESDGFAMSPAMSLISGVFCSALAQMKAHNTQENTKVNEVVENNTIFEVLNKQEHNVADQHELIKLYQNMYLERGYDQVQSLVMASVSAACNMKGPNVKPLPDAATEERVAARWDSIWNQLSADSSSIDKSGAGANEQANIVSFKAPFERYYNTNGQLIQNQINNKVA